LIFDRHGQEGEIVKKFYQSLIKTLGEHTLFAVLAGFFIGSAFYQLMQVLLFNFLDPLIFGWWSDQNLQDMSFTVGANRIPWGATLMLVLQVVFVILVVYGLGRWFKVVSKPAKTAKKK